MQYDAILIDMFNICYRKQDPQQDIIKTASNVVDFINNEVNPHLKREGITYLLFDPLPKSDLGMSKNFTYTTDRKSILPEYKLNRKHNESILESARLLRKYYAYRGETIKICICNSLEADDFVEEIVKGPGKKAMITTDSDWARYISDDVVMISKGFNSPYTKTDYYNEYGMSPTIATVTIKKALYGDSSDNVPSLKTMKHVKYYTDFDFVANSALLELSRSNMSLDEFKRKMKDGSFKDIITKLDRDPIEELQYLLCTAASKNTNVMQCFLDNIRVIQSRCTDIKSHIYTNPIDENYNKLMEATLNRVKQTKKFSFGRVKI